VRLLNNGGLPLSLPVRTPRSQNRRTRFVAALIAVAGVASVPATNAAAVAPRESAVPVAVTVLGQSVGGREIVATRYGDGTGKTVMIVGQIHGNEKTGIRLTREIVAAGVPAGYTLWVIETVNPDGNARNTRQNARGVDLNRNFPTKWAPQTCPGKYCAGRKPASEPETRLLSEFLQQTRPQMVVFYHAKGNYVDYVKNGVGETAAVRAYAKTSRLPLTTVSCGPGGCTGNATQHAYELDRATTNFVVELPCYTFCLSRTSVKRHIAAFWAAAALA
jgi:protein MpaA